MEIFTSTETIHGSKIDLYVLKRVYPINIKMAETTDCGKKF